MDCSAYTRQLKLPATNSGICLLCGSPVVLCTSPPEYADNTLSTAEALLPSPSRFNVTEPQFGTVAYQGRIPFVLHPVLAKVLTERNFVDWLNKLKFIHDTLQLSLN